MINCWWGGRLRKRFCNMFSESSTGSWAELQLPCCPSEQWELPENMLQNLFLNLPPQTVVCVNPMPSYESQQMNHLNSLGGRLCKRFCSMFSGTSPCFLGQHGSCSSAQQPVELSGNILQNLFHNLTTQTVVPSGFFFSSPG